LRDIFIIGSKGIPAKYGGFETFVEKLTEKKIHSDIRYHVSCLANDEKEFYHNNARCFNVKIPDIGSAKAIVYDLLALRKSINYIEENKLQNSIIYILACRIGPFMWFYKNKIKKLGIKLIVNPDGHEWKRSKWNVLIRRYWKYSERLMVKHSELLICDSIGIENYIKDDYKKYIPETTFIAYGADVKPSILQCDSEKFVDWLTKNKLSKDDYYLIVGRFVPENNYETIIREFMNSASKKDLVLITNVEQNKFYNSLVENTHFDRDKRIKFVGTVYDEELLKKIRENAFAYFHGHEVGGTNPSLLEALASTRVNILLDVVFNREVGKDGALYFSKDKGSLVKTIESAEKLNVVEIDLLGQKAKGRIRNEYSWDLIVDKYEKVFM
jgi:rhamnosyltransferase